MGMEGFLYNFVYLHLEYLLQILIGKIELQLHPYVQLLAVSSNQEHKPIVLVIQLKPLGLLVRLLRQFLQHRHLRP